MTAKAPALTTATACSRAVTGVGATLAAGSQPWKGKHGRLDAEAQEAQHEHGQEQIRRALPVSAGIARRPAKFSELPS